MKFIKRIFGSTPDVDPDEVEAQVRSKISKLWIPSVALRKTKNITISKLGGLPLVDSEDFSWPTSNGRPMAFLAQIDLSEMAQIQRRDWIADTGVLLFFYDIVDMPWGYDPKDRGSWQVIYMANPRMPASYPKMLDDECKLDEVHVQAELINKLPSFDHPSVDALNYSDAEIDVYMDLEEHDLGYPSHQFGGQPTPVQGDHMQLESQLASNGVYLGDSDGYESEKGKLLAPGATDWELLFQFDSDDDAGIMWGDCGMVYFWVQRSKSSVGDFSNCWLVLQCS